MSKTEHIIRVVVIIGFMIATWFIDIPRNASVLINMFGVVLLSLMWWGGRPE